MADANNPKGVGLPIRRILQILKFEKKDIISIYYYAILNGLIQLSLPLGIQSIISFVLGGTISTSLVILIFLVVLGVFFNGLIQVNTMKIIEKVQQKIFVRYSLEYAHRIPQIDMKSVDKYYLPELTNRFFDTISLQKGISKLLLEVPTATIQILFGLLLLSFYHPVFIAFGLLLVLLVYLILYFTASRGMESSLRESDYKYMVAGWLEELARVVPTFKFSRNHNLNLRKADKNVVGYLQARTDHFNILLLQYWTLIFFKVMITAAMLIVGAFLLVNQQLNIGQFIAAEIVILLVLSSVEKLIINLDKVYDVLTSVEKLGKILDKPLEKEGSILLPQKNAGIKLEVHELGFAYHQDKVIEGISFMINPGEKVAIMGNDGSGKSTLLRILSGGYQDFEGGVQIEDIPLRNLQSSSLRSQMGILLSLQDIFEGTLKENVTLGNNNIQAQQIMRLADQIGLSHFIESSVDGLDSTLNSTGNRLPRTVIQKVLLLRSLVNNPRLLLLEEPWHGLEESSRLLLQEYLLGLGNEVTMLIATNDADFAAKCDSVIYLKEGKLMAQGNLESVRHFMASNLM